MPKIKIEGLDKLQKALKENVTLNDVKRVVRHNGMQLQQKMTANAEFEKDYQTGTTKRSIMEPGAMEFTDAGLTVSVEPGTEYSPYVEYGTRFMDAQPFVRPAYADQKEKFKKDMDKLVR